jgi:hypothetical protein
MKWYTVYEVRNILHKIKRWKANWIGHILRRNCFLKHVTEGETEERVDVTGRRGRRRTQLLDDLKETIIYRNLKEEAPGHAILRTRFGRGYEPVARQTSSWSEYKTVWTLKIPPAASRNNLNAMRIWRISDRCGWRFRSSGLWLCVNGGNGSRRFETTCFPVTQGNIPADPQRKQFWKLHEHTNCQNLFISAVLYHKVTWKPFWYYWMQNIVKCLWFLTARSPYKVSRNPVLTISTAVFAQMLYRDDKINQSFFTKTLN